MMDGISDRTKCMASLAVFRTLYDQERDLYSVIASFCKQLIVVQKVRNFSLQQFCLLFKEQYGFDLPSAVIKTALKRLRFFDIKQTNYSLKDTIENIDTENVASLEEENNKRNQEIFDSLIDYVESESQKNLSFSQKQTLYSSFCSFVIDENAESEFKNEISSFVVKKSSSKDFLSQLNNIRLGLVIYVGLSYNTNFDKIDGIDTKLNIYLDTEILFHRAGYNGQLFKTLYYEFYQLVEEINRKSHKALVSLYYFAETDKEIRDYFAVAEDIIRGKKRLDPSSTAMKCIVDQCREPSDVKVMESAFFLDLNKNGIKLDRQENYYDKENFTLNIEQEDFQISEEYTNEDVGKKLKLLNYINIKRGGKSQNVFRNIGHILLTGNSLTFKIAFDNRILHKGDVPLATGLDFLTNRFWLIADKGLTSNIKLTSLNILTKAQIVMSSSLNEVIAKKFKDLKQEEKEGCFDLEKQKAALPGLHKYSVNPEDINSSNQDTYLNFLKNGIDAYLAEQEIIHQQAKQNSKLASNALDALVEQENFKRAKAYTEKIEQFKGRRNKWVHDRLSKRTKISLIWCIGYLLVVVIACIISLLKLSGLVAIVTSLLLMVVPYVRPLWNHLAIRESLKFLFSKKTRKYISTDLVKEYLADIEKRPILYLISKTEMEEFVMLRNNQ